MLKNLKQFNLPEIEEKVLEFWKENKIFSKTLSQSKGRKPFIFYEGPPTANGRPGTHHILARAFKDIICRYKTMQGFFVSRRAGWDTQGLPVEIEVEKQLGIKNKQEIEKFGIAEFNKKAKESVWTYKDEWEKLTERIGFWLDFKNAYVTYENSYLEKLWGVFKKIDKRGLLYKGHKVIPWCPRCGTALSSHELAQGYKEVTDKSVYVKFRIKNKELIIKDKIISLNNAHILSWTTTPWTLPGNVALAVGNNIDYEIGKVSMIQKDVDGRIKNGDILIYASGTLTGIFERGNFPNEGLTVLSQIVKGKDLVGLEYEPLFDVASLKNKNSYKIYPADFVTTTDGTGVVHTAVMYGEDDYELGKKVGLPQHHTVDKQGRFTEDVKELAGLKVKNPETEEKIFAHLQAKNYLLKTEPYKHEYPHCWRCGTAILYYANNSWFITMSKLRADLLSENKKINWIPEYLKEGRFGEWLRDVKDWAISRERYWGTPLPIWECSSSEDLNIDKKNWSSDDAKLKKCPYVIIGDLEDLNKYDYQKNNFWIGRHGESTSNIGNWISGDKETDKKSELTENGIKQIEISAQKLQNEKIDIIYSSPFLRTKQTAAIYEKFLKTPIIYDDRLAEFNVGVFNGRPAADIESLFFEHPLDRFTKTPPNGESGDDIKKRMLDFIKEINNKHIGKNIFIISHGDPLWILSSAMKNLSNEDALAQEEENYLSTGEFRKLEFNNWPFDGEGNLDLHRPYIDEIKLKCPQCKGVMSRVKEVADVWFDSGAMPFATGEFPDRYPADYICEAIDQTRGWFYTLLAVGVLMEEGAPYKNVISLGHVLDKKGQKMSKSKGNVVDPWELINKYGVDVVRWYFYTVNLPAEPKKFDEQDLVKTRNKFHNLIYNSYVFFETYSSSSLRASEASVAISKHILDQWILARLQETIWKTTIHLDIYTVDSAAKIIDSFVDDLSRWYIRRSRKRPEALPVLEKVLIEVSKLIAPFTPFFAEALFLSLRASDSERGNLSVHLTDWPSAERLSEEDEKLIEQMAEVRRLASLALAKRAEFEIKVRQPLASLKIKSSSVIASERSERGNPSQLLNILAEEINVKEIIFDEKIKEEIELDTNITPELKKEGLLRDLVRMVQDLRSDAGYQAQDEIILMIDTPPPIKVLIEKNNKFQKDINAKKVIFEKSKEFDKEVTDKIDGQKVWLAVKK